MKRLSAILLAALFVFPFLWSCTNKEEEAPVVKVQSIAIEQSDMTLTEGESVNLSAKVLPENAADKTVNWRSSNESVVMVSSNGKAMALSLGKAIITAKSGDKSDFITITVEAKVISVTGVSLDKTQITIKVGESETLIPTITPEDATNKKVSWTSSNDKVATVEDGKVVGVQPGSVTITVKTEDGAKTAECPVTVKSNLAPSVTVGFDHLSAVSAVLSGEANLETTSSADLSMGIMWSTNSGVLPSNSMKTEAKDINAKENSSNSYYYSVSIGELTPSTTYYYRSYMTQNGQDSYGEIKEFTTKNLASLLETKDATEIEATKATLNAKLDLTDVHYKSIIYGFFCGPTESALNTVYKCTEIKDNAIVAPLTGLSHKTQYMYRAFVTLDKQTFYGEVKTFMTDGVSVESVSLDQTEYTFNTIGNTLTLMATVLPADATEKSVEWSSDNKDVATVDNNGRVTAKDNGTAVITVKTKDQEKTATCAITVAQWVTSVTLNNPSLTLNEGQEQTLIPMVNPSNAADKSLNWTSSNTSVATVNVEGKVTAISKGAATIKAEAKDGSGVFASCAVRVKEPYTAVAGEAVDLGLSVKWSSTNLGATSPTDYGDYFSWGETSPKNNYSWETYELCNGSPSSLTKYNNSSSYGAVDNKSEFKDYGYENDAARQALGGKWRMPTDAEWTELRTKCTWTWTDNYNGTGVAGRIVTASNGNSIFLPAAGLRVDTYVDTYLDNIGSDGGYWSSSLNTDEPLGAWYVGFSSGVVSRYGFYRCYGLSVRPVSE